VILRLDRSLKSNCRGSAAVEFALVAPVLFIFFFSIIELGMMVFASVTIEGASAISARTIKVGNDRGTGSLETLVRTEIRDRSWGLLNSGKILVTTSLQGYHDLPKPEICLAIPEAAPGECPAGQPFEDRNGNGVYDGNLPSLDLGQPGDQIRINVYYPWHILSPLVKPLFPNEEDGEKVFLIRSVNFIKNEPF